MELLDPDEKRRVIIRARLKTIPGNPLSRPFTLGELFSQKLLGRGLRMQQNVHGFDAVHLLPNFDSENDVKGWFLYDFGVDRYMDRAELTQTQHQMYLAHFDERSHDWCISLMLLLQVHALANTNRTFILRELSSKYIQYFSALYKWGGTEIDLEIGPKVESL